MPALTPALHQLWGRGAGREREVRMCPLQGMWRATVLIGCKLNHSGRKRTLGVSRLGETEMPRSRSPEGGPGHATLGL